MATAKKHLTDQRVQGQPRELHEVETNPSNSNDDLISGRDVDLWKAGKELGRRSRIEQGLSEKIEDPAIVARLAALLRPEDD
jgi:hypothetical protein